jgi:hypothetical protein
MKRKILTISSFLILALNLSTAQLHKSFILMQAGDKWEYKDSTAENLFPHHVGDRWEYVDVSSGQLFIEEILRDSIGLDNSHNLFYNQRSISYPFYRIDTALNVFRNPQNPILNSLYYKLRADTGEVWEVSPAGGTQRYGWTAQIDSGYIFSQPTVRKIFRYNASPPDSATQLHYFYERWLASGFGLIYETFIETGYMYLNGCVIDKDTFGFVTSVESLNNEIPTSFALKQNFPNPFNPSTIIEFELPKSVEVNISIYDVLGRQLVILVDGWKRAGNYKIRWDARRTSNGLYFCRLISDGKIQVIKMLITK